MKNNESTSTTRPDKILPDLSLHADNSKSLF